MSDAAAADTPAPRKDAVIVIASQPYRLRWDRAAMYRADEAGAYAESTVNGLGFSQAAKLLWAMLPDDARKAYPAPQALAQVMPPVADVWAVIVTAQELAGEGMDPKKLFGSTNGLGASSS